MKFNLSISHLLWIYCPFYVELLIVSLFIYLFSVWVAAVGCLFLLFCQNQRPINETGSNRDSVPNMNHDINYCIAQSTSSTSSDSQRSYDLLSKIEHKENSKLQSDISTEWKNDHHFDNECCFSICAGDCWLVILGGFFFVVLKKQMGNNKHSWFFSLSQ